MNSCERQMVEILRQGRDHYGYVGVKAEFEAEGTRTDELLRLVEIARAADLKLGLKIGGCEAMRDLLESKQIGVNYIIAPMIETAYAASKFIAAKEVVFSAEEAEDVEFLFNLETTTAYQNRRSIVEVATGEPGLDGIVFGRVDYVGSRGESRDTINLDLVTEHACEVARLSKEKGLAFVVGGGVGIDALPALRTIHATLLTRFETRKVIFSGAAVDQNDVEQGLLGAVHFELLWLLNKRSYYGAIQCEDAKRIEMLEQRWNVLQGKTGKHYSIPTAGSVPANGGDGSRGGHKEETALTASKVPH